MGCIHLLQYDALGVRCASKGLLPLISQVTLLVVLVCPQLLPPVVPQLAPGSQSTCLTAAQHTETLHQVFTYRDASRICHCWTEMQRRGTSL